jgi:sugar/nucleoside kinase (ribokinase family)
MAPRAPAAPPPVVGVGGVFIDDIVLANGETRMGTLGGAAVHAMMGAALWGQKPGIAAPVGTGLPAACRRFLDARLDTAGLVALATPQVRAWQLFEDDGSRRELYRVADPRPFIEGLVPAQVPARYLRAPGLYLLQGFEGVRRWRRRARGLVLWEPLQQVMVKGARRALAAALRAASPGIVSPNLAEARAVYGIQSPEGLVEALLGDGARVVALRMGAEGSLVADAAQRIVVPAVRVPRVVDATGAGNTYCGALLAGLVAGAGLARAAAMGAVAASFCIEDWGVLDPRRVPGRERDRRLAAVLPRIKVLPRE